LENKLARPSADVFRLIAKNLTEMVMAYDMEGKLVYVNPAVETLTGYSVEEIEQANFILWVYPDDQPRMMAFWASLFRGQAFHEEEYRLITKDGRIKWVVSTWTPILDDSGRQVGVQGREFDVTQRKLSETALRHSEKQLRADEARYRVLFEDSPFPMWEEDFSAVKEYLDSLSAAGISDLPEHLKTRPDVVQGCVSRVRILDVNRSARDFYGASSKEELLGGLDRIFDEHAHDVFRDELVRLAGNHSSFQTEFPVRTLQGEERLVDMIVTIVDSARHDWSRVIVAFFDITDRKRLEEQFLQSQKMESLGRLAGGIAHDFNNLLTVINGYTDWILGDMDAGHPLRSRLASVRDAGERCAELTQQLLAFSRKQIIRTGPLEVNALIRESQEILSRVLGDDIRISTALAPDAGVIQADRSQMSQVLMNLAVNARDAMPGGGTLTIETASCNNGAEVLLEVRDTGQGMDESIRRHLFEPFFTTKKAAKNAGLGLAIVFGTVSHLGGRIEVRSQPGAGAAFRIFLPRVSAPAEAPPVRPVVAEGHQGSGEVLVVEDREDVRSLTCRMLTSLGYRPLPAASGGEAIMIVRGHPHPIPLLLTDVIMPGMNGRELADQLHHIYPDMKMIFMSGYTDHILTNTGTLDPNTRYLQKPFTITQLAAVLRGAL